MIICTAYNDAMKQVAVRCLDSIRWYCHRNPGTLFTVDRIPDDYPRNPSWYKLEVLEHHLQHHDLVLWVDADTLMFGDNIQGILDHSATLNISQDLNGINCGVMAWRKCDEAFKAIARLHELYPDFKDHIWWEQAALMTFVDTLNVNYVPKQLFNAYPGEETLETRVLHFPGMNNAERYTLMTKLALERHLYVND
jgi:hypothetical protein